MTWVRAGIACLALAAAGSASAGEYPSRTVSMIVPFAAGGPTDTVARLVGRSMARELGQQVLIENVAGAGGTVGAARAARGSADGYTIFLHHIGQATAPALYRKLSFDPRKDFEPIGEVADVPMTLVARKDFPAPDVKDLLAHLKANKDRVTYANAGLGSASHLCGLLLMSALGVDVTTVPYRGTGPAMNDLLGGQVDFMCDQTTNTTSQIKGGKIKAYAVTTKERLPTLANLPTLHESGLPGFEVVVWHGLYAPKGTPKPTLDRLASALQAAVRDPEVKARLNELGTEPVSAERARPEALRSRLEAETAKWGAVIQKARAFAD